MPEICDAKRVIGRWLLGTTSCDPQSDSKFLLRPFSRARFSFSPALVWVVSQCLRMRSLSGSVTRIAAISQQGAATR